MRIVFVGHTVPHSGVTGVSLGINKYAYNLCKEIKNLGNDVELLIRNDFKPKEEWIRPVFSPKATWIIYPYFVYPNVIRKAADIFHADYVNTFLPLSWLKKRPRIVSIHDVIPLTYDLSKMRLKDRLIAQWYRRNFKKVEKEADAVFVASNQAREEALRLTKIPEEKLFAVHYGVEFDEFFPVKKKESDVIKIGYIGGLDGRKNVEMLVEAFRKISSQHDNVELHIAGTGRNLQRFRSMNIPRAFFHGWIADEKRNEFLNSLDIFVFPSLAEGLGCPPQEAMACRLPVVGVNSSAIPELIGDDGILVEPNVDSMVEGISRLVENKSFRNKLAEKGYKKIQSFTWENAARQVLEVYEKVVG